MDKTVMIIDHSEYEREKVKIILDNIDEFSFIDIKDLNQFQNHIKETAPLSLIIMDIAFPSESDGFKVLSSIRDNTQTTGTPVVITTKSDNPEHQRAALKYNVGDFIIKPYQPKRLENSVRSVLKIEQEFNYTINSANVITMSIEDYITKEFKLASRSSQNLSIVFITPIQIKKELSEQQKSIASEHKTKIYNIAAENTKLSSRSTDTIILNDNRDILMILPFTNSSGAEMVLKKVVANIRNGLSDLQINYDDFFYAVHVTFPADGKNFQALMEKAMKKVESKIMLEKITYIGTNTLEKARNTYKKFKL
ncbi:MAG: response regulator [Clostridiaceae bacterium]|nr:response regulator [Clostridiaceae bacterium]